MTLLVNKNSWDANIYIYIYYDIYYTHLQLSDDEWVSRMQLKIFRVLWWILIRSVPDLELNIISNATRINLFYVNLKSYLYQGKCPIEIYMRARNVYIMSTDDYNDYHTRRHRFLSSVKRFCESWYAIMRKLRIKKKNPLFIL